MSLLKDLAINESNSYTNTDVAYMTNILKSIQEEAIPLNGELKYTADMVPIIKLENYMEDGSDIYCVENADFTRLLDNNNLDVKDGVNELLAQIKSGETTDWSETEDRSKLVKEFAIVIDNKDIQHLYESATSDPTNMIEKSKSIKEYVQYLEDIKDTGCNLLIRG